MPSWKIPPWLSAAEKRISGINLNRRPDRLDNTHDLSPYSRFDTVPVPKLQEN
jgi:hypothetical protein